MAKKNTTKVTKQPKDITIKDIAMEAAINAENELKDIIDKMETVSITDEVAETILHSEPEVAQAIMDKELAKIDEVKNEMVQKLNDIVKKDPSLSKLTSNACFTNYWNGCFME